ncbi:MAG TPA: YdcF family protein [Longimicrobiaceae bacterium]|nr:YdcF family protein [Longimicrobiaceae bacterium]
MTPHHPVEPSPPADAIVVLSGGVGPDGSLPVLSRTRVERAAQLFHGGIAPRMVMSGRCGLTAPEPAVTEAAAMAAYARELGVPEEALLLEEESRDTLGNAYFTRERLLRPGGWTSIRVVTSDFHLSRAAWVFRKVLGPHYDFSFVSAASGLSPRELIDRALEECRILIFLNEWLQALEDGDDHALDRLMEHEHPGYADAPALTHDQLQRRLDEIARIDRIAGSVRWISGPWDGASERRAGADRRARRSMSLGRR